MNTLNNNLSNHLIDIANLSKQTILDIINKAESYIIRNNNKISYKKSELLKNKNIITLFFEPSTRTRSTFEIAAKNLSANIINLNIDISSVKKGESLKDTILTINAMDPDCLVVRHKQSGIAEYIANLCNSNTCLINAGDGTHAHPTQGLLDIFTIYKHKPDPNNTKIAIIGDVVHSRVAKSQITALQKLGYDNIHIIGPEILLPQDKNYFGDKVTIHKDLKTGIKDADIVSCLRLQKERMQHTLILDDQDFFNNYGITNDVLKLAKPDAIVMHPGPINREIEISSEVADGPRSVILEQVSNGVAVRMAVFDMFVATKSPPGLSRI